MWVCIVSSRTDPVCVNVHVHNWGCACVYAHMCGGPSFTLLSSLVVLHLFTRLLLSLPPQHRNHRQTLLSHLFAQLLRSQTQVLRFAWQTHYLMSHLPDPEFYLNYVLWLFLKTKTNCTPSKKQGNNNSKYQLVDDRKDINYLLICKSVYLWVNEIPNIMFHNFVWNTCT